MIVPQETKKYVLTGAPFTGKTTVLDIIKANGYPVVPETARMVIEEEQAKESAILPWKDLSLFQEKVVMKQAQLESEIFGRHVFLDRGILDSYAYSKLGNVDAPLHAYKDAHLRYAQVFILELLPGYTPDTVRKETADYRHQIHQALFEAYEQFGYAPIVVPILSPENRAEFIRRHIDSK